MSEVIRYPSAAAASSDPSVGPNGAPIPTSSTLIGSEDLSGNLQPASASNPIPITIAGGLANPLPVTDATTHTELTTINTTLGTPMQNSGGSVTANAGTNLNTSALATSANLTSGTQKTQIVDGSGNVIASTSNALNVQVENFPATQPVSGTVTANQGAAGAAQWLVSDATTHTDLATINTTLGTPMQNSGGSVTANAGTNLNTSALATSANLTSGTQKTQIVDGSGNVIASTSNALNVFNTNTPAGNTPLQFVRNVYSSTNVTTSAYVQLIAATPGATNVIETFDSSGQTLVIAFGAMGSEVDKFILFPGGNGRATCSIPTSTRVSIKALSATANTGELDLNLYT